MQRNSSFLSQKCRRNETVASEEETVELLIIIFCLMLQLYRECLRRAKFIGNQVCIFCWTILLSTQYFSTQTRLALFFSMESTFWVSIVMRVFQENQQFNRPIVSSLCQLDFALFPRNETALRNQFSLEALHIRAFTCYVALNTDCWTYKSWIFCYIIVRCMRISSTI